MLLRFASPVLPGQTVTLTATQALLTAGPTTRANYGVPDELDPDPPPPPPPPIGTVEIRVNRTTAQCNPDSVRLSIVLPEGPLLGIPAPEPGTFYDRRLNDLIYLWDMGVSEEGEWTAPVNVLAEWKNRRYAKGPWVSHMFLETGTKNVSVQVINPATLANLEGEASFFVRDANIFYSAANSYGFTDCATYVINPIGDTDWTGEPAGAIRHNADTIHYLSLPGRDGGPRRYLFKRGATFNFGVTINNGDSPHIYFGDYGNPADAAPILNAPGAGENHVSPPNPDGNVAFDVRGDYGASISPASPDFRVANLNIQGRYDPTTYVQSDTSYQPSNQGFYLFQAMDFMVSNCTVQGFRSTHFNNRNGGVFDKPNHNHWDNYIATDLGGQYPHIWVAEYKANNSVSFTGCRIMQNPSAFSQDGGAGGVTTRSLFRINDATHIHMRCLDGFSNTLDNTAVKILNNPAAGSEGQIVNIHSCFIECPGSTIVIGGNLPTNGLKRTGECAGVIIDGVIVVTGHAAGNLMGIKLVGITIRNNLLIVPDTTDGGRLDNAFSVEIVRRVADGILIPDRIFDAPINIYNNTLRFDRPLIDNGKNSFIPAKFNLISEYGTYSLILMDNNIWQGPWEGQSDAGQESPFAPLSLTVLITPRLQGKRPATTFVLDPTKATPPDAVKESKPTSGSTAIGAATTGPVAYWDGTGAVRTAPRDIGWIKT